MLIDLIAVQPPLLLAGAVAVYAAVMLHLVARDIERARWQREFGGWRALQRDRIERLAQPRGPAFVRAARRRRDPTAPRVRLARRPAASHRSPGEMVADRLCGAARRVHRTELGHDPLRVARGSSPAPRYLALRGGRDYTGGTL